MAFWNFWPSQGVHLHDVHDQWHMLQSAANFCFYKVRPCRSRGYKNIRDQSWRSKKKLPTRPDSTIMRLGSAEPADFFQPLTLDIQCLIKKIWFYVWRLAWLLIWVMLAHNTLILYHTEQKLAAMYNKKFLRKTILIIRVLPNSVLQGH